MQESAFDLTRGMVITATFFVVVAWTVPATHSGFDPLSAFGDRLTEPWHDVEELFSNAVEALKAPVVKGQESYTATNLPLDSERRSPIR